MSGPSGNNGVSSPAASRSQAYADWVVPLTLRGPKIGWALVYIGSAAFVCILALGFFTTATRFRRSEGRIVPTRGVVELRAPLDAVVSGIHARIGDELVPGSLLLDLASVSSESHSPSTSSIQLKELGERRESLLNELARRESQLAASDLERIRISALAEQSLAALVEQREVLFTRWRASSSLHEEWQRVYETGGPVSKLQVIQQLDATLAHESAVGAINAQVAMLRHQHAQAAADALRQREEGEIALAQLRRELANVNGSISSVNASEFRQIISPSRGRVVALHVEPGQSVEAQQLLAAVAADGSLVGEFWISSGDVGMVRKGNRVILRYKDFPYGRYGEHESVVQDVAGVPAAPTDVLEKTGIAVTEPRYRVTVSLPSNTVGVDSLRSPLAPGMIVEAQIELESRSPIGWLFDLVQSDAGSS